MFNKLKIGSLVYLLSVTSIVTNQIEYFHNEKIGYWSIIGYPGNQSQNLNKACIVSVNWEDSSSFLLIQDLDDGELFLELNNNQWNISGPYGTEAGDLQLTLNMHKGNRVESLRAKFSLVDKNTIQIRAIDFRKFLPSFMSNNRLVFIMPGSIMNAELALKDSTKAIESMSRCIKAGENVTTPPSIENFERKPSMSTGPEQET